MKECDECGQYKPTELVVNELSITQKIKQTIFPQYQPCVECGAAIKQSGWFERNA